MVEMASMLLRERSVEGLERLATLSFHAEVELTFQPTAESTPLLAALTGISEVVCLGAALIPMHNQLTWDKTATVSVILLEPVLGSHRLTSRNITVPFLKHSASLW